MYTLKLSSRLPSSESDEKNNRGFTAYRHTLNRKYNDRCLRDRLQKRLSRPDAHSPAERRCHADVSAYSHSDSDPNTGIQQNEYSDRHTQIHANERPDSNAHGHSKSDFDTNANADANHNTDANRYPDSSSNRRIDQCLKHGKARRFVQHRYKYK